MARNGSFSEKEREVLHN